MCICMKSASRVDIAECFLVWCAQHEQNSSAKTGVGTPIYMAPEIIYGGNRYDAKVRRRHTTGWTLRGTTAAAYHL